MRRLHAAHTGEIFTRWCRSLPAEALGEFGNLTLDSLDRQRPGDGRGEKIANFTRLRLNMTERSGIDAGAAKVVDL